MISQYRLSKLSEKNRTAFLVRHGLKNVKIWSGEWQQYWMSNGNGYCLPHQTEMIGWYSLVEAYDRSSHCGPEKKIFFEFAKPYEPHIHLGFKGGHVTVSKEMSPEDALKLRIAFEAIASQVNDCAFKGLFNNPI